MIGGQYGSWSSPIHLFGKLVFVKDLWQPLCGGGPSFFNWYDFNRIILIEFHTETLWLWVPNRNTQYITSLKQTRSHCRHPIRSGYTKIHVPVKPLLCKSSLYIWKNRALGNRSYLPSFTIFLHEIFTICQADSCSTFVYIWIHYVGYFWRNQPFSPCTTFFGSPCNVKRVNVSWSNLS